MSSTADRDRTVVLLHVAHLQQWNGRPHRCRVYSCSGLVDPDGWTTGLDIWASPPYQYHGRGRAIDLPPRANPFDWIHRRTRPPGQEPPSDGGM